MSDSLMLNVGGKLVPTTSTALSGKSLPPASRPKKSSMLHRLSIRDSAFADSSNGCFVVEMEPHLFEPLLGFLKGNGLPLAFGRYKERLLEAAVKLGLEERVMEREWAAKARRAAEETVKESDGISPRAPKGIPTSLKNVLTALGDVQNDRAKVSVPGKINRDLGPPARRSPDPRKRSCQCECAKMRCHAMTEMQRSQRIASLQSQLVQSEAANTRLREEVCNFQESQRRFQTCVDRKSQIFDTIHQQYKRACQEREEYLRKQMGLLEQRCERLAQRSIIPIMVDARTSPSPIFSESAKSQAVRRDHRPSDEVRTTSTPILTILTEEDMNLDMPEILSVLPTEFLEETDQRTYGTAVEVETIRKKIFRDMELTVETKAKSSEELYIHGPKRPYSLMERTIEGQCSFGPPSAKRMFRSRNRSTIQVTSECETNIFRRQVESVPVVPLSTLATFACLISPDVGETQARLPVTGAEIGNVHTHFRSRSHPSPQTYNLHLPNIFPQSHSPPMGAPIAPCFERFRLNSRS